MKYIKNIKDKVRSLKYWILINIHDFKIRVNRFIYCNRGYHRISSSQWQHSSAKINLKVNFIKCCNCRWLFFSNDKDKKIYDKLKEMDKKMWVNHFKNYLKKGDQDERKSDILQ